MRQSFYSVSLKRGGAPHKPPFDFMHLPFCPLLGEFFLDKALLGCPWWQTSNASLYFKEKEKEVIEIEH